MVKLTNCKVDKFQSEQIERLTEFSIDQWQSWQIVKFTFNLQMAELLKENVDMTNCILKWQNWCITNKWQIWNSSKLTNAKYYKWKIS